MSDEQSPSPWSVVALAEYSAPQAPAAERVRTGFGRIFERLRSPAVSKEEDGHPEPELPPIALLDRAVPEPLWSDAVRVLDGVLESWVEGAGSPDDNVRVIVGPSGAAADEVVSTWARQRRWPVVAAPTTEQILAGGGNWSLETTDGGTTQVILRLDELYLRHHSGLALLERLVEDLRSGPGRFVIGCGSWSWAYLNRALKIENVLGEPLTIQGLDQASLREWFGRLAAGRFEFCQASGGRTDVIVGKSPKATPGGEDQEGSDFLKRVAAFSFGIPLVAWATWRQSLRLRTEDSSAREGGESTLWIPEWSDLDLPVAPAAIGPCEHAVVHEALLQGQTTAELLTHLLPFSATEIASSLHLLLGAGLLESETDHWRVSRLGYPAARHCLQEAGYLTGVI